MTSSNAATPSSSSPPVSEFLVGFQTVPNSRLRKLRRNTGITSGFITPAGTVSSDCTRSDVCYINSQGQLSLVSGATYSTNTGVASEPFVPSTSPGTISTTWQLSGTVAKWNHAGFLNGTAALCLDLTFGTVQVYFNSPPPTSCIPVILISVPVSSCSGLPPSATSVPPTPATGTTAGSTLSPSTSSVVSAPRQPMQAITVQFIKGLLAPLPQLRSHRVLLAPLRQPRPLQVLQAPQPRCRRLPLAQLPPQALRTR
ncbi:hypothetical protein ABVK25_010365 [Lepraria finkii]|uniref:DUF7908 domain-containing protein n=1 Tax=Lepraria finkii TaxID=1340010 RepID=A0ABR4AUJ0_9LECA